MLSATGSSISSSTQVHPGDVLTVNVIGFSDNITPFTASNISVSAGTLNGQGGVSVPVIQFSGNAVQIELPLSMPIGTSIPLTVGLGTRISAPVFLNVHN